MRPFAAKDASSTCLTCTGAESISFCDGSSTNNFTLDKCFAVNTSQEELFEDVRHIVEATFEVDWLGAMVSCLHTLLQRCEPCLPGVQGYHGTIMAYGQVTTLWIQSFLWPELVRLPPLACLWAGMPLGCLMESDALAPTALCALASATCTSQMRHVMHCLSSFHKDPECCGGKTASQVVAPSACRQAQARHTRCWETCTTQSTGASCPVQ